MTRYIATVTLRVEYDATDTDDARNVAETIADTVRFPAPSGRAAELLTVRAIAKEARS